MSDSTENKVFKSHTEVEKYFFVKCRCNTLSTNKVSGFNNLQNMLKSELAFCSI